MLLRRYITTTYGKTEESPFELSFFILNRPLLSASREYTPRRLPFFVFCGSRLLPFFSWKMSSSYFFFFLPTRKALPIFSLSSFLVFPDWQVWCCLSMMVTCCWLLPRPQTRQLHFVVHPYAYTYVHLFFPPPLLPRELLRLYSPYENPVPGYRPSCDGGTWWPSPAVARVASHNSSSQELFWGIRGYELVASRQNTYWQRATSQLLRQNNKRRDTKNKVSSVCQLALHNSCWGRNSPTF